MNVQLPASTISLSGHNSARPSANFHPSVWGEFFLEYDSSPTPTGTGSHENTEHKLLKEEVREMILEAPQKSLEKLELIDAIQRLGVNYHFESEIDASLKYIYDLSSECFGGDGNDIYAVALRFRLLRQKGYPVSCDVFNIFKDTNGKFDAALLSNVGGILSLYEATHLRVHGEDILEEGLSFTTTHLKAVTGLNLSKSLATQVTHALNTPIRKTVTRVGAREYISIYQEDAFHNKVLLKFAKLDFNMLMKMHQKELSDITRWWKKLDVPKNFPFTRDRLVECYFWMIGVYYEPAYSLARMITTKTVALIGIMDDIYDVYGSFDELQHFTHAIQRWDIAASDHLPSYMKHLYLTLLNMYSELEIEFSKKDKLFVIDYAKEEIKKLSRAYFQEAKWYHEKYIPKFEEYMKIAVVSASYIVLEAISFIGMDIVTPEVLKWVTNEPSIVMASSVIARLVNDSAGHEAEQERGHVASAIESYMNEYGISKEDVYIELSKRVTSAWKDVNKECLIPLDVSTPFLTRILNFTRVLSVVYARNIDGFTISKVNLENVINKVFITKV